MRTRDWHAQRAQSDECEARWPSAAAESSGASRGQTGVLRSGRRRIFFPSTSSLKLRPLTSDRIFASQIVQLPPRIRTLASSHVPPSGPPLLSPPALESSLARIVAFGGDLRAELFRDE